MVKSAVVATRLSRGLNACGWGAGGSVIYGNQPAHDARGDASFPTGGGGYIVLFGHDRWHKVSKGTAHARDTEPHPHLT